MSEQQQTTGKVFTAIHGVLTDIAKSGVGKNATNTQQNFKYRANEDVMDALSPLLAKHHLLILPCVEQHSMTERQTRSGAPVLHTLLKLTYKFVCPLDGSTEVVGPIYGESMDAGDKSTNKAMTAAYKYLCIQSMCIPFSGDDPDAQSHEIAPASAGHGQRPEPQRESPSSAASALGSPTQAQLPHRPSGAFGYGKKCRDVPWDLMKLNDLEWFLNADRTPEDVREKIVAELAWRDHEAAQLERVEQKIRDDRAQPLEEDIP